jgi:signal transduction histidine kinase
MEARDTMNEDALSEAYAAEVAERTASTEEELRSRIAHRLVIMGEMTAGIVHDFRNVLTVIQSGLNLAQHAASAEDRERYLAAAHEGLSRGKRLTDRLLDFAKQGPGTAQTANPNELLRRMETFLSYCVGPHVEIVFDLAPGIPPCILDAGRFNAAVLNLAVNARDAMPEGGVLAIATSVVSTQRGPADPSAENHVCVRIGDSGRGMRPDVLARVFDPFFTTKGESGTGLGLPQVKSFMEKVGGRVAVSSEVGKGTTVSLFFRASETPVVLSSVA